MIEQVSHRPWPLPDGPWVMKQTWNDLLFAHWAMLKEDLQKFIPSGYTLDTFQGKAWLGIVPFRMSGVRLRGIPAIPGLSAFPELNVRTYVSAGGKRGVFFFSLDTGNPLAVVVARCWYHLPYFSAQMSVERNGDQISYSSSRKGGSALFEAQYRPIGEVELAEPNSLEHWLTERYCLYAVDPKGHLYRGEIHHLPWPLQPAEVKLLKNTMTDSNGISLPAADPLLHFSERQEVLIWPIQRV